MPIFIHQRGHGRGGAQRLAGIQGQVQAHGEGRGGQLVQRAQVGVAGEVGHYGGAAHLPGRAQFQNGLGGGRIPAKVVAVDYQVIGDGSSG